MAQKWIQRIYLLLWLSIPLTISVSWDDFGLDIPSEPIMVLLIPLVLIYLLRSKIDRQIWFHPISIIGLLWCGWMFLGVPFSSDPVVTLKFAMVNLGQWILFFIGVSILLSTRTQSIIRWHNYYSLSILLVLIYALYTFSQYDFRMDASVLIAKPFYFDHSLLSACLSILIGIYGAKSYLVFRNSFHRRTWIYPILLIIFLAGVVMSFSRAAWIALLLSSLLVLLAVLLKKNARFASIVVLFFVISSTVFLIQWNKANIAQATSHSGDWFEHIQSIANLENNISNLERLNRYRCAIRMSRDRPITGFGAGTFPIAFIPYQKPEEMTRISVTTPGPHPPGRGGSTHSEYLRALSEMGFPGLLIFLALLCYTYLVGFRIYSQTIHHHDRILALGILFGLTTFFIHGLFNNFLHQGKLSVLFWSSLMCLVLMDLNRKQAVNQLMSNQ